MYCDNVLSFRINCDEVNSIYVYTDTMQVRNDYLRTVAESIDHTTAIRLGCIEMRRLFINMSPDALLKKSNMEYIEKVTLF